ncbi:hypothetical protein [Streptomyces sp. MNU103]|uniref:hypothetical protein n=1 Tax=Streptomyces sp. MNU103 TaxID=2560024 RepID=UPI001E2C40A3|nr:hypothetical protein [Streptomyces sp. MNU103]
MQALVPTQTRTAARALAVVTLLWAFAGAPGQAAADACAYASTGPNGTEAVAIAGHIDWDVRPASRRLRHRLPPHADPTPTPTPTPLRLHPLRHRRPRRRRPSEACGPSHRRGARPPAASASADGQTAPDVPSDAPAPPPRSRPRPSPRPTLRTVTYPHHRATEVKRPARSTTSPLVFVLLITTPAVVAVAALRPR